MGIFNCLQPQHPSTWQGQATVGTRQLWASWGRVASSPKPCAAGGGGFWGSGLARAGLPGQREMWMVGKNQSWETRTNSRERGNPQKIDVSMAPNSCQSLLALCCSPEKGHPGGNLQRLQEVEIDNWRGREKGFREIHSSSVI